MDAVVFASRVGDVRLELHPAARPYESDLDTSPAWLARLTGRGMNAERLCPEAVWQPQSLAQFLASLDANWRGWEGERVWQSEEVEMRLTARHNKTNTVVISVELTDGAPPHWCCNAEIEVDPGVFKQLAEDAKRLGEASVER